MSLEIVNFKLPCAQTVNFQNKIVEVPEDTLVFLLRDELCGKFFRYGYTDADAALIMQERLETHHESIVEYNRDMAFSFVTSLDLILACVSD